MPNFYMRIFHKWNDMQTLQKTSESVVIVNATCFVYLIRHSIILSLVSTRYFVKIRNTDSQLLFINRNELVLFEYRRCSCVCVCLCFSFLSFSLLFLRAMISRQNVSVYFKTCFSFDKIWPDASWEILRAFQTVHNDRPYRGTKIKN